MKKKKNEVVIIGDCLPLTIDIAKCLLRYFPHISVFCVQDILGEDHVFAKNEIGTPMFDMLISTRRKFAFIWYYIHLYQKGIEMVREMKDISLKAKKDFVIKFPNFPKKRPDIHTTIRWGKKSGGKENLKLLNRVMVKKGNLQLEDKVYSREELATVRDYNWNKVPGALDKILAKAKLMALARLKKHPERVGEIRGYCLYAGCAYYWQYPKLGFGMRDIDVNVFFSPKYLVGSICTFTENCGIEEFGRPQYCDGETRWLDLMWNTLHSEAETFDESVLRYVGEMRQGSDRWATISQRPIINLETGKVIYTPNWLKKMKDLGYEN
jgi:hypothetical protein